jgi:hypothetical protein
MNPACRTSAVLLFLAVACAPGWSQGAGAQVEFRVAADGLPDEFRPLELLIKANLLAAAREWAGHVRVKPCTIDIVFRVDANANAGRGSGRSLTTARLANEKQGDKLVLEQGWASEMRTGTDPNGPAEPDVEVVLAPDYLRTLWWDPHPDQRRDPVPGGKLDAQSVVLHELGHALAFNGWIDPQTGELAGQYASSYDRHVRYDTKAGFTFHGPEAVRAWGGPVPLARVNNNYHHVGDKPLGGRDADLTSDLMNGVVLEYGRRYWVGRLDLAILADCGIPLVAPDPPAKPARRAKPTKR